METIDTSRKGMISSEDILSDIVCKNIDLLPIIFRLGIGQDMGKSSIKEICNNQKLDVDFLLAILNTYNSSDYFPNTDLINLTLLTDFLTKTHEYHKLVTLPLLAGLMQKLKDKFPDTKLIITLEKYLENYVNKLISHIEYEEKYIFPLVDRIEDGAIKKVNRISAGNLKKLFSQHANVEMEVSDLIIVLLQHIPSHVDVQLFHDMLHTLIHFEKEQIDHARFEDKILFPRLLKLYQSKIRSNASQ